MMVFFESSSCWKTKSARQAFVDNKKDKCQTERSKNGYFFGRRNRHSWGAICWLLNSTLTIFGLLDQKTRINQAKLKNVSTCEIT